VRASNGSARACSGQAEVEDLRLMSAGDEDVGGLDVAVHDPLRV
jgi:hypothetical protein